MVLNGKTYASTITSELMPYALNNTAEILNSIIQKNSSKNKKIIQDSSIPVFTSNEPLYTVSDVEKTMENVVSVDFNTKCRITPNISVTFIPNGHLLGASSIFISIKYKGEKTIYLFFSGDYSKSNIFFDVKEIPKDILSKPINIITESTYGDSSRSEIKEVFDNNILYALSNKETVIIPVFSLGRSQEILLKLKILQDRNMLSKDIPIYLDGKLAQSYTTFYLEHKQYLKKSKEIQNFLPANLNLITEYEERQNLLSDRNSKIILTTSGMGSYGPAQLYLPYYISRPKCTIHFCGFTTPNTFGSRIKEIQKGEIFELNGVMTTKQATVLATNEFSGHAKKEDLLELISAFDDIKSIMINHGDSDVKVKFAKYLMENVKTKNTCILSPKNCIRIGAYGLIKTYKNDSPIID